MFPFIKLTLPVGTVLPEDADTCAVKVTVWPATAGLGLTESAVVVAGSVEIVLPLYWFTKTSRLA